jgi:ADP-L-glycero-D-manno-heptose 6-epimerase
MKFIVTGGAGFIGSCIVWKLNQMGVDDILIVDRLDNSGKWRNLVGKKFDDYMDADELLPALQQDMLGNDIEAIIHMGANSSTVGTDADEYMRNNYQYTRALAEHCVDKNVRFIYASSAATYGDGSLGFSDDDNVTPSLKPLNVYGYSKQLFDLWVLKHKLQFSFVGLKFFNVFGPNEYHKADMMSLICKRFDSVARDKRISLFKSYHPDYQDGEQKRDFIYVKDVADIIASFIERPDTAGIFNVGTGVAQSWNDIARAMFKALDISGQIDYIEMPEILRDKYQYFTQADMGKLRAAGYKKPFTPLDDAVRDYAGYLKDKSCL